jgi:hypothetical protein
VLVVRTSPRDSAVPVEDAFLVMDLPDVSSLPDRHVLPNGEEFLLDSSVVRSTWHVPSGRIQDIVDVPSVLNEVGVCAYHERAVSQNVALGDRSDGDHRAAQAVPDNRTVVVGLKMACTGGP